jgi:hypothetical protein
MLHHSSSPSGRILWPSPASRSVEREAPHRPWGMRRGFGTGKEAAFLRWHNPDHVPAFPAARPRGAKSAPGLSPSTGRSILPAGSPWEFAGCSAHDPSRQTDWEMNECLHG